MIPANASAFLKAVKDALHEKLLRSSAPIVYDDPNKAEVRATGVLFRVLGHHFLLSASHVLKETLEGEGRLHLGVALADNFFFPLAGGATMWAVDDDRYDVGAVLLPGDVVDMFTSSGFAFLDVSDVEQIDPSSPAAGGYAVFGYPSEATAADTGLITPAPHYFSSVPYRGDTNHLTSTFDPKVHFLLKFDRSQVRNTDTGEMTTAPHPGGLSGGAVWWAYSPEDITGGWRKEFARLVGLQSAYYPSSGLLKIIPWTFVRTLLIKKYPHLEPALRLLGAGRIVSPR